MVGRRGLKEVVTVEVWEKQLHIQGSRYRERAF